MMRAIAMGDVAQVEHFLKEGVSPNARQHGRSLIEGAMEVAFINGDLSVMRSLLQAGAQLPKPVKGPGHLYKAVSAECYDMAELLVEFGADYLEYWSAEGEYAYDILRYENLQGVIEKFARIAPDVNLADAANFTLLHRATMHRHHELVRILIERGANLGVKDSVFGETPIYMAIRNHEDAILKMLVAAGASLLVVSDRGRTPLDEVLDLGTPSAAITIWEHLGLTAEDKYKGATLLGHFKNRRGEDVVAQWSISHQTAKDLMDAFGAESTAVPQSQGNQTGRRGKRLAL